MGKGESCIKRKGCKMEVVRETFINPLRRIQSVLISCTTQKDYLDRQYRGAAFIYAFRGTIKYNIVLYFNYLSTSHIYSIEINFMLLLY